jgi:hypothetical protein
MFPRVATTLMVVAAMLLGGGVAKMAHLWTAHSHHGECSGLAGPCGATHAVAAAKPAPAHPAHGSSCAAPDKRSTSDAPADDSAPGHDHGDCATCAELAVLSPTTPLESPFTTVLAVLSLVHDSEAAQASEPAAPDVCAARPPPACA